MGKKHKKQSTFFYIKDGKFSMHYDSNGGGYPEPTFIIKDIDYRLLLEKLGVKDENNLMRVLSRLPKGDNDVVQLKNFCDGNDIEYAYILEE